MLATLAGLAVGEAALVNCPMVPTLKSPVLLLGAIHTQNQKVVVNSAKANGLYLLYFNSTIVNGTTQFSLVFNMGSQFGNYDTYVGVIVVQNGTRLDIQKYIQSNSQRDVTFALKIADVWDGNHYKCDDFATQYSAVYITITGGYNTVGTVTGSAGQAAGGSAQTSTTTTQVTGSTTKISGTSTQGSVSVDQNASALALQAQALELLSEPVLGWA